MIQMTSPNTFAQRCPPAKLFRRDKNVGSFYFSIRYPFSFPSKFLGFFHFFPVAAEPYPCLNLQLCKCSQNFLFFLEYKPSFAYSSKERLKVPQGRDCALFTSVSQHLKQCLAHGWCSINVVEWVNNRNILVRKLLKSILFPETTATEVFSTITTYL